MGRPSGWDLPDKREERLRAVRAGRSGLAGSAMRERYGERARHHWREWDRQAVDRGLIEPAGEGMR